MSMFDEAAVALLRASTVLPRGSMRLARMLAGMRRPEHVLENIGAWRC